MFHCFQFNKLFGQYSPRSGLTNGFINQQKERSNDSTSSSVSEAIAAKPRHNTNGGEIRIQFPLFFSWAYFVLSWLNRKIIYKVLFAIYNV